MTLTIAIINNQLEPVKATSLSSQWIISEITLKQLITRIPLFRVILVICENEIFVRSHFILGRRLQTLMTLSTNNSQTAFCFPGLDRQ